MCLIFEGVARKLERRRPVRSSFHRPARPDQRRALLDEQFCLKIEAGRQAHVSVDWPGKTIGAAMPAAPAGIDRAVERQVRRIVAGDNLARTLYCDPGFEGRQAVKRPQPSSVASRSSCSNRPDTLLSTPSPRLRSGAMATATPAACDRPGANLANETGILEFLRTYSYYYYGEQEANKEPIANMLRLVKPDSRDVILRARGRRFHHVHPRKRATQGQLNTQLLYAIK